MGRKAIHFACWNDTTDVLDWVLDKIVLFQLKLDDSLSEARIKHLSHLETSDREIDISKLFQDITTDVLRFLPRQLRQDDDANQVEAMHSDIRLLHNVYVCKYAAHVARTPTGLSAGFGQWV